MNSIAAETGFEQIARAFASLPSLQRLLEEVREEAAALRAELAEARGTGIKAVANPRKWLKLKEAAELLNTSPKTVRRYVERGLLRRNSASRHILIPVEDVENLNRKVIL